MKTAAFQCTNLLNKTLVAFSMGMKDHELGVNRTRVYKLKLSSLIHDPNTAMGYAPNWTDLKLHNTFKSTGEF